MRVGSPGKGGAKPKLKKALSNAILVKVNKIKQQKTRESSPDASSKGGSNEARQLRMHEPVKVSSAIL
jgi:hypothetical protein